MVMRIDIVISIDWSERLDNHVKNPITLVTLVIFSFVCSFDSLLLMSYELDKLKQRINDC